MPRHGRYGLEPAPLRPGRPSDPFRRAATGGRVGGAGDGFADVFTFVQARGPHTRRVAHRCRRWTTRGEPAERAGFEPAWGVNPDRRRSPVGRFGYLSSCRSSVVSVPSTR